MHFRPLNGKLTDESAPRHSPAAASYVGEAGQLTRAGVAVVIGTVVAVLVVVISADEVADNEVSGAVVWVVVPRDVLKPPGLVLTEAVLGLVVVLAIEVGVKARLEPEALTVVCGVVVAFATVAD